MNFLKKAFNKNSNGFKGDVLILLYHRIVEIENDPWSLCVKPENFKGHIEILKQYYNVIKLSEVVEYIKSREIPNKSVVITFDDGYSDNVSTAKPMLEELEMPFTVFVTTGCIEKDCEFWWDTLEKAVFSNKVDSDILRLEINGKTYVWNLGNEINTASNKPQLLKVYYELWELLQSFKTEYRTGILNKILDWSGQEMKSRNSHRNFDIEDIKSLEKNDLVDIGSHTVNHPRLSSLSTEEQLDEIKQSKQYLENRINRSVEFFSYPFGGINDYTQGSSKIVQEAGFKCACNNIQGVITYKNDLYNLPRIYVNDVDIIKFQDQIDYLFNNSF